MIKQNRLAMIYNTTGLAERRFNFSKRFICHPSTADEAWSKHKSHSQTVSCTWRESGNEACPVVDFT